MLQVAQARMIAGREPGRGDIEPLSFALWELVAQMSGSTRTSHRAARDLRPRPARLDGRLRRLVTPALAEAPVRLDAVDWRTDDPMGLFTRSARSRRSRRPRT